MTFNDFQIDPAIEADRCLKSVQDKLAREAALVAADRVELEARLTSHRFFYAENAMQKQKKNIHPESKPSHPIISALAAKYGHR